MSTKSPRNLKQRIKDNAPAILVAAGTITVVSAYVYVTRNASAVKASQFLKNAADPTVEIIFGDDNAFVVMTTEAMEHLHENNVLKLLEDSAGSYILMFAEGNA